MLRRLPLLEGSRFAAVNVAVAAVNLGVLTHFDQSLKCHEVVQRLGCFAATPMLLWSFCLAAGQHPFITSPELTVREALLHRTVLYEVSLFPLEPSERSTSRTSDMFGCSSPNPPIPHAAT